MSSSGAIRLDDPDCPACERNRSGPCSLCRGGAVRKVKLSVATQWILEHYDDLPDTEPGT